MMIDTAFKLVALRRGDHWRLSEGERGELGMNAMRCVKTLPMIPEDKLGKYAPWFGLAMVSYAVVMPRVEADQSLRRAIPSAAQPRVAPQVFERVNGDELRQQFGPDVEIRTMTADEYAAFLREQGGRDGGDVADVTVAATDDSLLDRTIVATQGVDQGTLAFEARAAGRLTE